MAPYILDSKDEFETTSSSKTTTFGLPYDYGSVMQYRRTEFAADESKPTIVAKVSAFLKADRIYEFVQLHHQIVDTVIIE